MKICDANYEIQYFSNVTQAWIWLADVAFLNTAKLIAGGLSGTIHGNLIVTSKETGEILALYNTEEV